jgi:uncharacterized membrane protein
MELQMTTQSVDRSSENTAPLTATQSDMAEGIEEGRSWGEAALIGRTFTVARPRAEVYAFFRDFRNFPRFMKHVSQITASDEEHAHWVVRTDADRTVEWDTVLTEDKRNATIAWRSVEGASIRNSGRLEFRDAPSDKGTEVTATIVYEPSAGELGKLMEEELNLQTSRDLFRFKRLIETGEIAHDDGDEPSHHLIFI